MKRSSGHKWRSPRHQHMEQHDGGDDKLWRKETDADCDGYLVVTHWESKEAHNQWTRSEAFKAAHSGPRADFIVGHPEFGGYEVRLHSSSMEAKVRV